MMKNKFLFLMILGLAFFASCSDDDKDPFKNYSADFSGDKLALKLNGKEFSGMSVSFNSKIIVFDEPTSSLTEEEVEHLFRIINMLRDRGMGIIYISHKMAEIKRISDEITVMRDGQLVATRPASELEMNDIIRLMVGRTIYEEPKTKSMCPPDAPVVLEAEHLNSLDVKDVSFQLRKGEILGFAGLVGTGRTETLRLVYGADKMDSGEVYMYGKKLHIRSPKQALAHGIALVPEDRKLQGVFLHMSIKANTNISILPKISRGIFVQAHKETENADQYIKSLRIRTPGMMQLAGNLSGGNQQKVALAKALATEAKVLILDEPTRGIDVGAKMEIYQLMRELSAQGMAIIMISSEMDELLGMSDRIVVMSEGRKAGELSKEEFNQERILNMASGE